MPNQNTQSLCDRMLAVMADVNGQVAEREELVEILRLAFQVGVFRPRLGQLEAQEPGVLTDIFAQLFHIRPFAFPPRVL